MASAYGVENASVTYGDTLAQRSGGLALGQPNQNGGILKKGEEFIRQHLGWVRIYIFDWSSVDTSKYFVDHILQPCCCLDGRFLCQDVPQV